MFGTLPGLHVTSEERKIAANPIYISTIRSLCLLAQMKYSLLQPVRELHQPDASAETSVHGRKFTPSAQVSVLNRWMHPATNGEAELVEKLRDLHVTAWEKKT
jgi:hypothetical protein